MLSIKKTNWFKYLPYNYKLLLCDKCQSLLSRKQIKVFEENLYSKGSFCFWKSCISNQTEVDTWVRKWTAATYFFNLTNDRHQECQCFGLRLKREFLLVRKMCCYYVIHNNTCESGFLTLTRLKTKERNKLTYFWLTYGHICKVNPSDKQYISVSMYCWLSAEFHNLCQ